MSTLTAFPPHKSIERFIRRLDEQGTELTSLAESLKTQIHNWHEAYVRLGAEYIEAGGTDPEILEKIYTVTKTKEIFGAYIL